MRGKAEWEKLELKKSIFLSRRVCIRLLSRHKDDLGACSKCRFLVHTSKYSDLAGLEQGLQLFSLRRHKGSWGRGSSEHTSEPPAKRIQRWKDAKVSSSWRSCSESLGGRRCRESAGRLDKNAVSWAPPNFSESESEVLLDRQRHQGIESGTRLSVLETLRRGLPGTLPHPEPSSQEAQGTGVGCPQM